MANSKRKCPYCKERQKADDMFIVGIQAFCNKDHYIEYQVENKIKLVEKGRKIKRKEATTARRDFNKKDIKWQHKQCQTVFNRLRVLQEKLWFKERGIEHYCISCLKTNMDWCCGHFKTRGSQPNLRYDESNTFLQCNRYCNMGLSGNIAGNKNTIGYIAGLKHRFGLERATEIIDYCESNTKPVKWTCEQLEEMRKGWNEEIRRIEKLL